MSRAAIVTLSLILLGFPARAADTNPNCGPSGNPVTVCSDGANCPAGFRCVNIHQCDVGPTCSDACVPPGGDACGNGTYCPAGQLCFSSSGGALWCRPDNPGLENLFNLNFPQPDYATTTIALRAKCAPATTTPAIRVCSTEWQVRRWWVAPVTCPDARRPRQPHSSLPLPPLNTMAAVP